jgi:flagellar motor switch protein FliG
MNMNDKRVSAYNRILKKEPEDAKEEPKTKLSLESAKRAAGAKSDVAARSSDRLNSSRAEKKIAERSRPDIDTYELPGLIKVPSSSAGGKESSYRKVAKFLLLIGVEEAAKVMSHLSEDQTEKVVLELASIRHVDKDEAAIVLAEFESLLEQAREPTGGVGTARSILAAAFGSERAEAMLQKAVPSLKGKPFDYLDGIDPDRLLRIIVDELPSVKALVLSQLKPKLAADVINLLEPQDKNDTIIRLAKLKAINPDILRRVDDTMREKVESITTPSTDSIDGRSALAAILKHMDGSSERAILGGLSTADPDLGKDIRERLFTINDIVNADDKFLQVTLRALSDHDIAVLVTGKEDSFRDKIFSNISRSRGAIVLEEEKIISPIARSESEKVTGSFFSTLRRAWESGDLVVSGRDSKEVWV